VANSHLVYGSKDGGDPISKLITYKILKYNDKKCNKLLSIG
jgi:hypothetical protein